MEFEFVSGERVVVKRQRGERLAFLVCCMKSIQWHKAGLSEILNRR